MSHKYHCLACCWWLWYHDGGGAQTWITDLCIPDRQQLSHVDYKIEEGCRTPYIYFVAYIQHVVFVEIFEK